MSHSPRGVVVLGSTGSVGCSTLDVLDALRDRFRVVGLAAGQNRDLLQAQIEKFKPPYASVDADDASLTNVTLVDTDDPLETLATLPEAEIVVVATTGHAAIPAVLSALKAGKIVALANKEAIVAAGQLVMQTLRDSPGQLRPVDSEHSALWQAMGQRTFNPQTMRRLILTASGGPFRNLPPAELAQVTPDQALQHPTWSMGAKITIDSATLMNKGFELIEASWLFDCPMENLDIVIHPQSIVHSMVEFHDGALLAQLGSHDMRIPIQFALTAPERPPGPGERLTIEDLSRLEFEQPDLDRFPALRLARQVVQLGGTYPAALSAADEIAVDAFLNDQISFLDIVAICQRVLDAHNSESGVELSLAPILDADRSARRFATEIIDQGAMR